MYLVGEYLKKNRIKNKYSITDISENLNLLVNKPELGEKILVKVRSTGKLLEAKIKLKDQNKAEVHLKDTEDGISPGQACVFYKENEYGYKVLGGGWIKS